MTEQGTTGWKVTSQIEQSQPAPDGRITQGVRVSFLTGTGTAGSVFVPLALYTPANVRAMIAERAGALDAVAALTSDTP